MRFVELAQLYIASRQLSKDYSRLIITTASRLESATGIRDVAEVRTEHIAKFMLWLKGYSGNAHTIAGYLRRVRSLLNFAVECKIIEKAPAIPKVRCPQKIPRAWGFDEFRRLYHVANCLNGRVGVQLARIWWPSLIATAYHTGSRIGALLQVRWSDIDLERGFLILRAETTKTKQEQVFKLPDYVIAKIKNMHWPRRELVWEWPHCRRYFFTYFRKKIARPAQLEPLPGEHFGLFHKIRRTSASLAALTGGISAAQTLLGHTSAKTTIRHYIDPRIVILESVNLPSLE